MYIMFLICILFYYAVTLSFLNNYFFITKYICIFQVNPEHYVFSTFGVLHVVPRESNDNQSLTAWQKEAVLFKALSLIPFYKNYLLLKMFKR